MKLRKSQTAAVMRGRGQGRGGYPADAAAQLVGAGLARSVPTPRLDGQAKERAALPATAVFGGFSSRAQPSLEAADPQTPPWAGILAASALICLVTTRRLL